MNVVYLFCFVLAVLITDDPVLRKIEVKLRVVVVHRNLYNATLLRTPTSSPTKHLGILSKMGLDCVFEPRMALAKGSYHRVW